MSIDGFQVLSDPTRRRILEVLRGRERPVNEVVDALGITQSGVSRHLRILRDAGFVRVRRRGQQRMYAIAQEPFEAVEAWVSSFRQPEDSLDHFIDALDRRVKDEIAISRARAAAERPADDPDLKP